MVTAIISMNQLGIHTRSAPPGCSALTPQSIGSTPALVSIVVTFVVLALVAAAVWPD
jgi:hypothetical protein